MTTTNRICDTLGLSAHWTPLGPALPVGLHWPLPKGRTGGGAVALATEAPRGGLGQALREYFCRPRRILLAIAAIWMLNFLDLSFTLIESIHGHFLEMNPIAAHLIAMSPGAVVAYKAGLVLLSSVILLGFRRHYLSELGAWMVLVLYVCVAIRWSMYFEYALLAASDPAVRVSAG